MKALLKFHYISYLILLALTLVMAIGALAAAASGNIDVLTGGLAVGVFVIFAILQIICLALYQPAWTVYKIGFYLLHVGLLILLAGLAAFTISGESITVQVPIDENGSYYSYVQNEEGEEIDLGFGFKLDDFAVEKYESGNDKYYKTNVSFADPTTLAVDKDYLEVNRTLRQNGWKIYLMSYSDGTTNMEANGLAQYVYEIYNAEGETAGNSIVEQIYGDFAGKWYNYYLFDEINGRFSPLTAEEIGTVTGSLWAYVFETKTSVTVYLTRKDGAFAETFTATGSQVAEHMKQNYADSRINYYYYTIDMGRTTAIDEDYLIGQCTSPVFVGIRTGSAGSVNVYVMKEEMKPNGVLSSTEGGSKLLSDLSDRYGAAAETPQYRIYSPAISDYTAATEEEILAKTGVLKAYAVYMGDTPVVFVHPLSNILLLKRDPGEYATLAGMVLVMTGSVLMCLFRKRRKEETIPDTAVPQSKGGKRR